MRHIAIVACLSAILISGPARAQQAQQTSTVDQRIGAQLGTLLIQNASLSVQIEQLQTQLDQAKARISELEALAKAKPAEAPTR